MINRQLSGKVDFITCVPSMGNPSLVPDAAERIAKLIRIPFVPLITKVKSTKPQKEMRNPQQQIQNLDGAFEVTALPFELKGKSLILFDDICSSGWTFAAIAILLKTAGSGPVYPVAFAKS